MTSNPSQEFRIFISSTFNDLDEERTFLMTRVFPKLIQIASERGVVLTPIGLRWGILTSNIDKYINTTIVDSCLKEIDASHCFIGIVGSRYGWCPTNEDLKNSVYLKHLPTLTEGRMSMTEIEMQFGVFMNKKSRPAFFFLKNTEENNLSQTHQLREQILKTQNNNVVFVFNAKEQSKKLDYYLKELVGK